MYTRKESHREVACPICLGDEFDTLDDGVFPAVKCRKCVLGIETVLTPDPVHVYSRDRYERARDHQTGTPGDTWRRFHHDTKVANARYKQLQPFVDKCLKKLQRVWCDIGCNNGAWLTAVRKHGWIPLGVELDPNFAKEVSDCIAANVLSFKEYSQSLSIMDVISFFDVLEHMFDPVAAVMQACNMLRTTGGLLIIEVPHFYEGMSPVEFVQWKHRRISQDITEHIWHFSETSLLALLERYAGEGNLVATVHPIPGKLQVIWQVSQKDNKCQNSHDSTRT